MKKRLCLPVLICVLYTNLAAQWVSVNGPYGGQIDGLMSNEDYVFANKPNGLYRSADVGLTWARCDTSAHCMTAIHHQNLLRRTDQSQPIRFTYSSDNGDHWQEIPLPDQVDFAFNFAVKDTIIVFTNFEKLYRSSDLGQNWQSFQITPEPFHNYSFLKTIGNRIYLGNRTRLLYSEDGLHWNLLSAKNSTQEEHFTSIFLNNSLILAQISQKVWRSTDGGLSWEQTNSPQAGGFVGYIPADFVGINDTLFASTGEKLLRSLDNGLNWNFVDDNGSSYSHLTSFGPALLTGAINFGVNVSTDMGQTFQPVNRFLQGGDVWSLALKNNDLWLFENAGVSKLDAAQIEWDEPILHKTNWGTMPGSRIYPMPTAIVVIENFGPVIRSWDDGQSWDTISPANNFFAAESAKIEKKADTLFLINSYLQLFQSTDLGNHWEWISPNINPQIDGSVSDITVQGSKVFFTNRKSIFRSDDNLQTWQLAGDSLPFDPGTEVIRVFATHSFLFAWVNEKQL